MSLRAFCDELISDQSIRRDGREGFANERIGERIVNLNTVQLRGMCGVLKKEVMSNDSFDLTREATTEVLTRVEAEYMLRERDRCIARAFKRSSRVNSFALNPNVFATGSTGSR